MSTYIYLTCTCHEPELVAEDESGQHLYDLPRIQDEIANRGPLVARWRADYTLDYFERVSARFLSQHEDCVIGIRDEYGERHPTTSLVPPMKGEEDE